MTVPLWVLAVGAIVAGFVGIPARATGTWNWFDHFLEPVIASRRPRRGVSTTTEVGLELLC